MQGSAAADLRRGGRFCSDVISSSSQNAKVKELLKTVHTSQSYHKNSRVFFD